MDESNSDSVFLLITSLCEKFCDNPSQVKKLRSKSYEILLGKITPKLKNKHTDLKGTDNPFCNLLAWQYKLIHQYDLKTWAKSLETCNETCEKLLELKVDLYSNILKFLLSLRDVPKPGQDGFSLSVLPELENPNFDSLFQLPNHLKQQEFEQEKGNIFSINTRQYLKSQDINVDNTFGLNIFNNFEPVRDEGYGSLNTTQDDLWEYVSKLKFTNRRTWESFGYAEPDKEKPFLSELGELSTLWVENLTSFYGSSYLPNRIVETNMKSRKAFIKDCKYLLVGMASESFDLNEYGKFELSPVLIHDISPSTLKTYCSDLLIAGDCYKALHRMANPSNSGYESGYIFSELCRSVNRYLQFYRTAVMSLSDTTLLLKFHCKTEPLRKQISILASVCKVGDYSKTEQMPHGVALLNYLYQKVLNIVDENISTVLFSILYPCCQIYFSRFLSQWIIEGSVKDPYNEFFINTNYKYMATRGRTYWTRTFSMHQDMVPDFLIDLRSDILNCGKAMNLLKLCNQSSKLVSYLMGNKPSIIRCCLTHNQLQLQESLVNNYYLEVCESFIEKFTLRKVLERNFAEELTFIELVAAKREATMKKLELQKQREYQMKKAKKQEDIAILKEQYDLALKQKHNRLLKEIEEEVRIIEENAALEERRQRLIEQEADNMIEYYSKLCRMADIKRTRIELNILNLKNISLDDSKPQIPKVIVSEAANSEIRSEMTSRESKYRDVSKETDSSSGTSFHSLEDKADSEDPSEGTYSECTTNLDIVNANRSLSTESDELANNNFEEEKEKYPDNIKMYLNNLEMAKKIKRKIMNEELGLIFEEKSDTRTVPVPDIPKKELTEAQKNKLKVLSSEFGLDPLPIKVETKISVARANRNKNMATNEAFRMIDNSKPKDKIPVKRSKSLILNIEPKEADFKPVPMSVDSTPVSELVQTPDTVSSVTVCESIPNTGDFNLNNFDFDKCSKLERFTSFSKRLTQSEAQEVNNGCLNQRLHQSVAAPLLVQLDLANSELLRFFVTDLKYLNHLENLRNYFFLQDGEFGRNITENLFEKLYDANFPIELINCRTLKFLVFDALDNSSKLKENSNHLSFKINSLPKCFDLGDPDVLDCLSLSYNVKWPLNILLPVDTVAKYDEVFKFLLKLVRISWALKKIFMELKSLAKETGEKGTYLMSSPQYRKLHQFRHMMMHFIQTLQNYIVGEVLQSSWETFLKDLPNATNIDQLYSFHTSYIKNILFMCLLNQKSAVLRNVIHKIFVVVLKFYDYLRSRCWECVNGVYVHPNFEKLENIFCNFEEFVLYFFKVVKKIAKSGYQPHLMQLLEAMDFNNYYLNLSKTKIKP